jgi:hypothetical protein
MGGGNRRNSMRRWLLAGLLALLAGSAAAGEAKPGVRDANQGGAANDAFPSLMKLSGGLIGDIVADRESTALFGFEYRAGPELELLRIRPSLGILVTMDAAAYGWLGLNTDLPMGPLVLTLTTAVGLYGEGDGQDLGSLFVARNGAELAWRFESHARLGIGFHYYSNYGTGDSDPGISAITLVYAHPLRAVAR